MKNSDYYVERTGFSVPSNEILPVIYKKCKICERVFDGHSHPDAESKVRKHVERSH